MNKPKVGEVWIATHDGSGVNVELVYVIEESDIFDEGFKCGTIDCPLTAGIPFSYRKYDGWTYSEKEFIMRIPEAEWQGYNKECKK